MRERLRALLDKAGLLPAAEAVHRRVNRAELASFGDGLRFYVYNHWLTNFPSNAVRLRYLRDVLGIAVGY